MIHNTASNLIELCTLLRAKTPGLTTEESFDILQSLVGDDIRVRYETINSDCTVSTDCTVTNVDNVTLPKPSGGRFAHLNNLNISRVLLTSARSSTNFSRELVQQCNGVVLEYPSWRVLAVPARMFNPKFKMNDIVNNLADYTIYDIKDGTTVTLYYYPQTSAWCISSTNGFDVSEYQWIGPATYSYAINSVSKLYPDFSFDKLSKDVSYTIGFRYGDFHPLPTDPAKMWLIQSCDLSLINSEEPKLSISTITNIGLPLQVASLLPEITHSRDLLHHMQTKNANSLSKYITAVRNNETNPEIHYGFVLRSKATSNHPPADIILESELLKSIRGMMYNLPKRRYVETTPITHQNRLEYTILRAYLNTFTRYTFINLFPQFSGYYQKYDDIFNKLTTRVVSLLRNRSTRDTTDGNNIPRRNNIEKLAIAMARRLESNCRVNVMDAQGAGIVNDFLIDRRYLDLYYSCIVV